MDETDSHIISTPATSAVLFIPELLEAILLHIDMVTLLVSASRVSRHWRDVISKSSKLQEALFFKPVFDSQAALYKQRWPTYDAGWDNCSGTGH
ncbi:hypothetical protein QBC46DRAFT_345621 [Diplogelasinospora grovesii]|uniref:F-box domain-containing protein n=1 Tax=Diplogelasinospora grovesii TaxID=303347 RepID=A0AAN6N0M1_9PEZI|nr:hypothetical protein QBC46DRAFT_345621 [Diplogelasinospora grovesii]